MTLLARRLAWQKVQRDATRAVDLRAYLLSTFTVDPLAPYLGTALIDAGAPPGGLSTALVPAVEANGIVVTVRGAVAAIPGYAAPLNRGATLARRATVPA
mgnify:CR=1 FL=1